METFTLTPDREFLDPNFEGYKLSLDACPTFELPSSQFPGHPLEVREPNEDQYSFNHARLFGSTRNLLVTDQFHSNGVYLIDTKGRKLYRVLSDSGPPSLAEVFALPAGLKPEAEGDYNMSLSFASEAEAVLSDGSGMIFILETGDRSGDVANRWESLFHEEICGKDRPFVVSAASMTQNDSNSDEQNGNILHCLLSYVEDKTNIDGLTKPEKLPESINFLNVVEWMTFACSGSSWGLERVRRYVFQGALDYLQLSPDSNRLLVCTDKPYQVVFDSISGNVEGEESPEEPSESSSAPSAPVPSASGSSAPDDDKDPPPFYFLQDVEDIIIWVFLPDGLGAKAKEIKVTLKPREMTVSFRGQTLFGGPLWNVLDSGSLTWTLNKGKVEINVSKANQGLVWQRFLLSGVEDHKSDGEEVNNPKMVDTIQAAYEAKKKAEVIVEQPDPNAMPAFNPDQLEACDALPDSAVSAYVIEGSDNKTVQKASLEGHQLLFDLRHAGTSTEANGAPVALCLRHDVDGLVWTPEWQEKEEKLVTKFSHVGTFSALGYVQASKEQRKFSVAAPDLSYAAIVDRSRHIYIYRQPVAIAAECDLRNRKSGQKVSQIAKQQVVTLENHDEIVGATATNSNLLVATKSSLYSLRIN